MAVRITRPTLQQREEIIKVLGFKTDSYLLADSVCDNLSRTTSIGGTSTTCDILGNRTALGSSTSYSWDCLNRMTGFTGSGASSSYEYRSDGMRTHKVVGSMTTDYYHDAQMPMEDAVINGSSVTATRYGIGARGIDYEEVATGTISCGTRILGSYSSVGFPLYDAHGNMIATLARYGTGSFSLGNQRSYDAWSVIQNGASTGDPKNRSCAEGAMAIVSQALSASLQESFCLEMMLVVAQNMGAG